MPLLRSLRNVQGALAAIDMALLRSSSRWLMVTMRISGMSKFSTILLSQRRQRPIFGSLVVVLVCPRTGTLRAYTKWVYGVLPIAGWGACEKFHKSLAAQNFGC